MKFTRNKPDDQPTFVIINMIDVIFLLVIFFATTSLLGEIDAEIDLTLPSAAKIAEPQATPGQLLVSIKADNSVWMAGRPRTLEEFQRMVKEYVAAEPRLSVKIRGDKNSSHGRFVDVLDACRKAGVRDYRIMVLQKEATAS